MPIKRRISKMNPVRITPDAVEAFKRMEAAATDEEWTAAHSDLLDELKLPPWEFPAIEYPDEECPYPAGCHAAEHWQKRRDERPHAFELYRELQQAAREQ